MSKDPAFLFYPNDYIGGTMGMTFEEKGAYMELLMMQFNRGHMTSHMIGQTIGQLWDKVQDKFMQDSEGLWYNERLEVEKIKRQDYSNSRRNNVLGSNQHTKKKVKKVGHTTSHMEDEDINEDESIISSYWVAWKKYKKDEFGFRYKSEVSENAAKKQLMNLADGDIETAMKIIEQSIANGWKGFFKLNKDGKNKQAITEEEFAKFHADKLGVDSPERD